MSWISPTLIWSNNSAKATSAICSFGPPIHYSWQGDESHGWINWMPGIHQTDVNDNKDIKDFFKPPLFADGIFKSIFFNENCFFFIVITMKKSKGPNYLLNQRYPSLNAYVSSFGLGEFTFAAIPFLLVPNKNNIRNEFVLYANFKITLNPMLFRLSTQYIWMCKSILTCYYFAKSAIWDGMNPAYLNTETVFSIIWKHVMIIP